MRQLLVGLALCTSVPHAFAGMDMYLYNQCLANGGGYNMCFQNAQTPDSPQPFQYGVTDTTKAFYDGMYRPQRMEAEQQARDLENQKRQLEIQRMQLENERLKSEQRAQQDRQNQAAAQQNNRPKSSPLPGSTEWIGKAMALEKSGDWNRVLELAQQWTMVEPNSAIAWYEMGVAYRRLGRNDNSLIAFKEVLKIEPSFPDRLGTNYTLKGEKEKLRDVYEVLKTIDPAKAKDFYIKFIGSGS